MSIVFLSNSKHTNLALLLALKFQNLSGNFAMQQKLIRPVFDVHYVRIAACTVDSTANIHDTPWHQQ